METQIKMYDRKFLNCLGINTASVKSTLVNQTYSFDDKFTEESVAALNKKEIAGETILDILECILAAVEERYDNSAELELSNMQTALLRMRRQDYRRKVNMLKIEMGKL